MTRKNHTILVVGGPSLGCSGIAAALAKAGAEVITEKQARCDPRLSTCPTEPPRFSFDEYAPKLYSNRPTTEQHREWRNKEKHRSKANKR